MTARANWKGFLEIGALSCPVALYTAASTAERVSFHMLNRRTGNRLQRLFVDRDTGKEVPREEQVKGFEIATDDYVLLEPEEIAAAAPVSDKTMSVAAFVPCNEIDDLYLDRPYYLAPDGKVAQEAFAALRAGLIEKKVAALARAVLFRRVRTLLLRPEGAGMIATTLNFDYEVRAAKDAFRDLKAFKPNREMLDLARHIISTKAGHFDPSAFDDRYEAALVELVKAKQEGRTIAAPKRKAPGKVVDLMEALRQSAGQGAAKPAKKTAAKQAGKPAAGRSAAKKSAAEPRRKAG